MPQALPSYYVLYHALLICVPYAVLYVMSCKYSSAKGTMHAGHVPYVAEAAPPRSCYYALTAAKATHRIYVSSACRLLGCAMVGMNREEIDTEHFPH